MPRKGFVDLEEAVTDWAWKLYDRTATWRQRRLKDKQTRKKVKYININMDWSDVLFKDETIWTRLAEDQSDDTPKVQQAEGGSPTKSLVKTVHSAKTDDSNVSVLFHTKFTNRTDDVQEYTMKTEKTTTSSCMTEVENGFTKGFDLGVSLKTPGEVFEANAGYHREFSLTNTEGQSFEEELSWGVESLIKVKGMHEAEAQLVIKEEKQAGDFIIETRIQGMIYVTFTNINDNNSFIKSTGGDIADIVDAYIQRERRKGERLDFVEIRDSVIYISTKGCCRFRYGIKQEVKVDQKPLNNA